MNQLCKPYTFHAVLLFKLHSNWFTFDIFYMMECENKSSSNDAVYTLLHIYTLASYVFR